MIISRELLAADNMLDVGRPDKTLELLSSYGDTYFDEPFYWLLTGHANFLLENYEQAERAAKEGLALEADHHQLLFLRSKLANAAKDPISAEKYILAALKLFPERPIYLIFYAMLLARAGQLEKSSKVLDRARALKPQHPGIAETDTLIAYLSGDDRKANAHVDEAIRNAPDSADAYSLKGSLLMGQGKTSEGIANLRRGARMNPSDEYLVKRARSVDPMRHWSMIPLRPVERWGAAPIWVVCVGTIFGLRALGFEQIVGPLALVYISWVAYTWIAPRVLAWWLKRGVR